MFDLKPIQELVAVVKELIPEIRVLVSEIRGLRKEMAILIALFQEYEKSKDTEFPDSNFRMVLKEKKIKRVQSTLGD
jgi:hypothetical protein